MNHLHFIAIGGAAMHNLAIALHTKGYRISGSDDEIFEPSRGRLQRLGLLPEADGWYPEKITSDLDAVILGMHAKGDNPELLRAKELGLPIYSYPEFLYETAKEKRRIVIGGSHGKTTITAMILHVFQHAGVDFDYMVGAQLEGFEVMVRISDAPVMVFEGDEYLTSALDRRPKFHLYRPHIALISGIAWDHINVFPTFENYVEQFRTFIDVIEKDGTLIYCNQDETVRELAESTGCVKNQQSRHCEGDSPKQSGNNDVIPAKAGIPQSKDISGEIAGQARNDNGLLRYARNDGTQDFAHVRTDIIKVPYGIAPHRIESGITYLTHENKETPLLIFGQHNLMNLEGARLVCNSYGIDDETFYDAIRSFSGASNRLELIFKNDETLVFKDFAHAASKLKATITAVKQQYPQRPLVACMELHTYSSLSEKFLPQYKDSMDDADIAFVYFNPHAIALKKLPPITPEQVAAGFGTKNIQIFTDSDLLWKRLKEIDLAGKNLLMMSSGNFDGKNIKDLLSP
ncbi:MAG: Mur ligase family protein [Bacteroidales bacterium]|nr:Mur ligase family protein [Bacteroidales bacterium]